MTADVWAGAVRVRAGAVPSGCGDVRSGRNGFGTGVGTCEHLGRGAVAHPGEDERNAPCRIDKTGRGRFRLDVHLRLVIEPVADA